MRLTKTNVARLTLPSGKSESIVFDNEVPGFGIRIRAGGKRTWIAQYRLGAKQRRLTLGIVGSIDEIEARRRAKTALSKVHLGQDPQMEKFERRSQAAVTLRVVVESYLAVAERRLKPRSFAEVDRHLRQHWGPLAEKALATIHRADVASRLALIAKDNGDVPLAVENREAVAAA
jgi:hypothetical protein